MVGSWPIVFLMPRIVDFTKKDTNGEATSRDLCNRDIIFKYCAIDPNCKVRERRTAYSATKRGSAGTNGISNTLQKAE